MIFDFRQQKGPNSGDWTCVGSVEKFYESANVGKIKDLRIKDYPKEVFQVLTYNPAKYAVNITPDGFDDTSIYNPETKDVFSKNLEFSKISRRRLIILPLPEFIGTDCGREYKNERYFFLPYTQFLQKTLKTVPLDKETINKLQGYFSKEVEESYKGETPLLRTAFAWTINNFVSSVKIVASKTKEKSIDLANTLKSFGKKIISKNFLKSSISSPLTTSDINLSLNNYKLATPEKIISFFIDKIKDQRYSSILAKTNNKNGQNNQNKTNLEDIAKQLDVIRARTDDLLTQSQQLFSELPKENNQEKEQNQENKKEKEQTKSKNPENINFCQVNGSPYALQSKIIFNEIAWMGNASSSNNEWIELKNISSDEVNLSSWQILDKAGIEGKSSGIKIVLPNFILKPQEFFLLERTDDESAPQVKADQIYTGSLSNSNEALFLFSSDCRLQDKILANPNWPAGDNSSKKTMERNKFLGWQTSLFPSGTPKAENSSNQQNANYNYNSLNIALPESFTSQTNGGGTSPSSPQNNTAPKVTLSFAKENPVNKEIKVNLSVTGLKNAAYDIKISLESASGTISEIFNPQNNKWQSSVYYLNNVFATTSFSGNFDLRIKNEYSNFQGEANIIGKIRENGKTKYFSTTSEIKIIAPENQKPIACFAFSPENPSPGQKIVFDASKSIDLDGQITSYNWNFMDNTSTILFAPTTTHTFATSGQFKISLTITDNQGATSSTSTIINISQPKNAGHIIISEVGIKGKEFIELYNPTNQVVTTTGWYLSYFSKNSAWNNPWRKIQFPTTTIASSTYFLIGLKSYAANSGYPKADWQISNYTINLSDTAGAIGISTCNPKNASTTNLVKSDKIDLFSWKKENSTSTKVFEGNPFSFKATEILANSFQRKKFQGYFVDADDNSIDFETKNPTPTNSKGERENFYPPSAIRNVQAMRKNKNSVVVSWETSTDPDPQSIISYEIFLSKEKELTADNLNATSSQKFTTTSTEIALSGLDYDSNYYLALRAFDGLHYSNLTTSSFDFAFPKITGLMANPSVIREAINLFWPAAPQTVISSSSSVDSLPLKYEIKYAFEEITDKEAKQGQINWENATSVENKIIPSPTTSIESLTLTNLDPNKIYYFAVKSIGKNGTVSEISNIAKAKPYPGFKDNGDGTITDLYTGLMWPKDLSGPATLNGTSTSYATATELCHHLNFANHNDWRLPSLEELETIVPFGFAPQTEEPTGSAFIINNAFENPKVGVYWTSTLGEKNQPLVLILIAGLFQPNTASTPEKKYYFVPVRGPAFNSQPADFINNNDGTITDTKTNLIWLSAKFAKIIDFFSPQTNTSTVANSFLSASQAVLCKDGTFIKNDSDRCDNRNGVLYDNWRIPNALELINIANQSSILSDQPYLLYLSSTKTFLGWFAVGSSNLFGFSGWISDNEPIDLQLVRDNF